jgi:hypothetical protein
MKIACLFAAFSSASAVAPPRVSLSLDSQVVAGGCSSMADCNSDASEICQAGQYTSLKNCHFPVASAWDHQDKVVDVDVRIYKINAADTEPVELCNTAATCGPDKVDFTEPADYMFTYNAVDNAGNKAHQVDHTGTGAFANHDSYRASVFFNLQLQDNVNPVICYGELYSPIMMQNVNANSMLPCKFQGFPDESVASHIFQIEGNATGKNFQLKKAIAHDDITKPVDMTLTYTVRECIEGDNVAAHEALFAGAGAQAVERCSGESSSFSVPLVEYNADAPAALENAQNKINEYVNGDKAKVGFVQVVIEAHDSAGIFSSTGQDNAAEPVVFLVQVQDTTPPTLSDSMTNFGSDWMECGAQDSATSFDEDTDADGNPKVRYFDTLGCGSFNNPDYCYKSDNPIKTACNRTSPLFVSSKTFYRDATTGAHLMSENWRQHGTYQMRYDATDAEGNSAVRTRDILVNDTKAPTITLLGLMHQPVYTDRNHHTSFTPQEDNVVVTDECDEHIANGQDIANGHLPDSVSTSWQTPFNIKKLGSYIKTYTVSDQKGWTASVTRTYHVIDEDDPIITMQDCADSHQQPEHPVDQTMLHPDTTCIYEATRDDEYKDAGATCADFVDGQLNHRVTVGGDIVDLTIVGTYRIEYECTDLTGNTAQKQTRTIIVQDKTNPFIRINGNTHVRIEAGFPYTDEGASATDTLEGSYQDCANVATPGNIVVGSSDTTTATPTQAAARCMSTYGNSINEYFEYSSANSCANIFALAGGANSGKYKIFAEAQSSQYIELEVVCDMDSADNQYTYYQDNTASCDQFKDFEQYVPSDATTPFLKRIYGEDNYNMMIAGNTLCTEKETHSAASNFLHPADSSIDDFCGRFEGVDHKCTKVGTYTIKYSVTDHANNDASAERIVEVMDSLPPVISLRFRAKQSDGSRNKVYNIQNSGSTKSYADAEHVNPALDNTVNPYLHTESLGLFVGAKVLVQPGCSANFGAQCNAAWQNATIKTDNGDNSYTVEYTTYEHNGSNTETFVAASHIRVRGKASYYEGSLMAESAVSVSGWLIAAGVSGVAGVALLAVSGQKTRVTSVPV